MSWMKSKSSGWTAFDLKQRQKKQGLEIEVDDDPFPPVSTSVNTSLVDVRGKLRRNHEPSEKFFFLCALTSFEISGIDREFLEGMVPAGNNKEAEVPTSKIESYSSNNRSSGYSTFGRSGTSSVKMGARSTFEDAGKVDLQESDGRSFPVVASDSQQLCDDISELDCIIQRLQFLPIEPEWEEYDLYLNHRKDALKMMRSASNHPQTIQELPKMLFRDMIMLLPSSIQKKAREDWLTAEKLNDEAAKKIIGITNKDNGIWKLDLHGLHATEAVQALQERLQKIEGHFTVNSSVSPNRGRPKNAILRSASQEPFGRLDVDGRDSQKISSRQLRNSLQVVTGIGKHSRGHASLPQAVKTFFEDNR